MEVKDVAIQGGLGSFHHQAATELLGNSPNFIDKSHFRDVAMAIDKGECDAGLMAIENSIAGSILPNYTLIHKHNLQIIAEIFLPISMNFMVLPGIPLEEIEKVYSHQIALLQCDEFLENHPKIQRLEYEDTAKSAKKIKEENLKNVAAIGSKAAAEMYGLDILAKDIQTNKDSFTRFVLLSKKEKPSTTYDKVSLRFTLPHTTGKLSNVLLQFTINQFNLTKIQSMPIVDKPWQYAFYIDLQVHDKNLLHQTLNLIAQMTKDLEILGKYQNGNLKYVY